MAMTEDSTEFHLIDFCLDLAEDTKDHEYANGIKIGCWDSYIYKWKQKSNSLVEMGLSLCKHPLLSLATQMHTCKKDY